MKNLVFVIALALIATTSYSQKADFSGSWKINLEKSELGDQFSLAPNSLILKHSKKKLEMERNSTFQGQDYTSNDVFTLDGKESVNPGWMGSDKTSTAVLDKKTKVLTISSIIPMDDGSEAETMEEMSMDGDNLVVDFMASSPMGEMFEKYVFDKE